ncbi:pilus assembly PilX family protein [Undibacterium sp. SXout7W]|uniref:pilus assembly PilX family protein n=1 Tax=Undibacterium sp. SXout7W TaxID=3413049 RepID=UPI003BF0604F
MYIKKSMKIYLGSKLDFKVNKESGASLVVSLLMLIVVLILSISLATMSLQNEKASRSDRDRQIALSAAEAALKDAETDIDPQIVPAGSRNTYFDPTSNIYFEEGCAGGTGNPYQGMCLPTVVGIPVWQSVDLADTSSASKSVAFGRFTGQTMITGKSSFPAQLPRYIIEVIPDIEPGKEATEQTKYLFRITAIGFGANVQTQVVLQSYYRKAVSS